jgi:hypothetical protein
MIPEQSTSTEQLRELQSLLHLIVQKLTRQVFTTPRLTQIDVGQALVLVQQVDYPKALIVRKSLAEVIRELGKKRPDLYRHIITLEDAVRDLDQYVSGNE